VHKSTDRSNVENVHSDTQENTTRETCMQTEIIYQFRKCQHTGNTSGSFILLLS
jgi:hypothetical protein